MRCGTSLQQTTNQRNNNSTTDMNLLQIQQTTNDLATAAAEAVAQPTESKLSLFELASKGGWIMVLLAILSVIAVYIFIERYIALSRASKYDSGFMDRIREYMKDGKLDSDFADD